MPDGNYGVNLHSIVTVSVLLIVAALLIFAWSRVFAKAGYSPLLALLMIIPVVNLVTFLWLAFSKWPVHKRLSS